MCDHRPGPNPRCAGACVKCGATVEPRDLKFESEFLEGAQRRAGIPDSRFQEKVEERLAWAETKYGLRWRTMGLRRLLREIREEGLDIGGWPALAAQSLELDDMPGDEALAFRMLMQEAACHGALLLEVLDRAGRLLADNGK